MSRIQCGNRGFSSNLLPGSPVTPEAECLDVPVDQKLDGPAGEVARSETVESATAGCGTRTKNRPAGFASDASYFHPRFKPLERFWMEWNAAFFPAFSADLQHAMSASLHVVHHSESNEFPDPTAGVGKHREDRSVANPGRRRRVGSVDEPTTIKRSKADGLPITGDGRSIDEVSVSRVPTDIAISLQVAKQ